MAAVTLEHISKTYPGNKKREVPVRVIDDISFTVRDKEFMVIVGPSGCGKSTLLRMIAGLEEIDGGVLSVDGRKINGLDPSSRDIAMVFQNYALYPHMTVFDNMAFGLKLKGCRSTEIKERVTQTARLLEMEELLNRKPKTLSGGQRQRVAIGRAIIRRPKVFLFDEPLSNLDAKLRSQMRLELQKLHREISATIIYVTHDQTEAMTLGNRIAVLNKGKLMQLDTPLQLYNKPDNRFVAGFIGSPTMNFLTGIIENREGYRFVLTGGNTGISVSMPSGDIASHLGRKVILGVRPEHVLLNESGNPENQPDCILEVSAFENMGNEQLVYLKLANHTIVAGRPPNEAVEIGSKLSVCFLKDKLLLMDADTGFVINGNWQFQSKN